VLRKELIFILWSGETAPQNKNQLFARCAAVRETIGASG
jgi:hypothetical protein